MNHLKSIMLMLSLLVAGAEASASTYRQTSPDGKTVLEVKVDTAVTYSVEYQGTTLLLPSRVALDVRGKEKVMLSPSVKKVVRESHDRLIEAVVPVKSRTVRDRYNELGLVFKGGWSLEFRVYDNGVAYRFGTAFKDGSIIVEDETAEFNFASDNEVYWSFEKNKHFISHCEAFFKPLKLSAIGTETYSYLPVSMSSPEGVRMVVTETDLHDYPNLFLFPTEGTSLVAEFPYVLEETSMRTDRDVNVVKEADYIAKTSGTRTFPWRIMTIGDDRSLLENTLSWQLASAQVSDDTSWIRPGKISWEWWCMLNVYGVDFKAGVNDETYRHYVDFAAEYGLEYILLDEGWSASTMNVTEPKDGLDLVSLIEYAKSKGVGVVLWTLWTPMVEQGIENILDVYEKWGVSGIKIDFMQMNDQNMVNFYEDIARECFERKMLVDFHGSFKPSGLQRKYPNVMTFEGVYGMEHDKCSKDISPEHDLVLPFTRMVAGPMDYTPGATMNATEEDFAIRWNHPMSQGTRAHQAAIFIAFESPLQMLCDSPSNYRKAEEFTRFIAGIPTVWDETRAIEAKAGDYLLVARRSGEVWYVAGLNDWTGRELELPLDFLGDGQYEAEIFMDGVNADVWAEDYSMLRKSVSKDDVIPVKMANGGGWAAVIKKAGN